MATITPPSRLPVVEDTWEIITPAHVNVSRWTGSRQVQLLKGARFACMISLAPRKLDGDAKAWRGFLAQLDGVANVFPVYPEAGSPQHAFANPLVAGASQTGNSLNVDGLNNGNGNTLLTLGDWMTIPLPNTGVQLVMITSMTATSSGAATINFAPILREAPADNAVLETINPYALMASREKVLRFKRDLILNHGIELEVEEAW